MDGFPPLAGLAALAAALGLIGWSMRGEITLGFRALAGREPASRANLSARYWALISAALVAMLLAVAILMFARAPGWPLLVVLALVAFALGSYVAAMVLTVVGRRRKRTAAAARGSPPRPKRPKTR